jgi:hypothetical protein
MANVKHFEKLCGFGFVWFYGALTQLRTYGAEIGNTILANLGCYKFKAGHQKYKVLAHIFLRFRVLMGPSSGIGPSMPQKCFQRKSLFTFGILLQFLKLICNIYELSFASKVMLAIGIIIIIVN